MHRGTESPGLSLGSLVAQSVRVFGLCLRVPTVTGSNLKTQVKAIFLFLFSFLLRSLCFPVGEGVGSGWSFIFSFSFIASLRLPWLQARCKILISQSLSPSFPSDLFFPRFFKGWTVANRSQTTFLRITLFMCWYPNVTLP